jgi:tape measure domain-containing protein
MAETVGIIEYIVRADVAGVIRSTNTLDRSLSDTESSFGRVDVAARQVSGTLSSLSTVAYSVISALAVDKIIKYADAWTIVGNKVTNYLKDGQDLVDVQNAIFKVAQDSSTPLQAVATLYGRLEPATKGLINSGDELIKITETINKAFVVSGATSEEASNAIVQLSQALGAGALRSEEFNSVNEQGPRIMQGIADYMGVARGELKSLAAQGKITTEVVINSLRQMSSSVDAEFSKMNATFEMKGTQALNNLTKSLGSNSDVQSAVSAIGDAMVGLSENIDTMVTAGQAMATLYGARLVGAIAASTAETVKSRVAAHAAAMAASAEAVEVQKLSASLLTSARNKVVNQKATVAQISAERAYLSTAQASLTAQLSLSASEKERTAIRLQLMKYSQAMVAAAKAEAAAIAQLSVVSKEAAAAQATLATSTTAATAASRAATASLGLLRGALALVGGPAGLLLIAAAGVYYLSTSMSSGSESAINYASSIDSVAAALKDLNKEQLAAEKVKLSDQVLKQRQAEYTANEKVRYAERSLARARASGGDVVKKENDLALAKGALADEQQKLNKLMSAQSVLEDKINRKPEQKKEEKTSKVSANAQKILDDIKARTAAEKAYGTAQSARILAEKDARDAGVTDEREIQLISDAAAAQWEVTNARKEGAKSAKDGASEIARNNQLIEEEKLKTQQLNAQYTALYATEEKVTSGKLRHTEASARLEAQQKLSSGASKEQIDALAKEIYAQDQMAAKLDARIDRQKKLDEAKKKSIEQAAKDRELQDKFDPVAGTTNKYAEESAMLLEARQKDLITEQTFQMQKAALANQYEQQRLAAAEELYRAQSDGNAFVMDSVNALGQASTSTISGLLSGTMSATEAMQNFANIILNQAVGALVGMGIEYVKQQLLQQTMAASASAAQVAIAATTGSAMAAAYAPAAAMASLASFGANAAPAQAGIASTVAMSSGLALAGGRQYGGPVNPGSMYRVGEGDVPELISSGGSSYMIPGSRGQVTPMDGTGGGVTFNITNQASDMVQTQQSYDPETRTVELAITAVANQINSRTGKVGAAMKSAGAYNRLGG